jgi:digeranylgeranylglycerophospholipid reductase
VKPVADVDVLVIGLGPAGGMAAAAAARRGLRVAAIDRKKTIGVPVQCAEFIPLPLARHAQARGVLAQRITGMRSMLPSGATAATPFQGLMVDRAAFDRALARAAEAAGAALHANARLESLDPAASTAVVRGAQGVSAFRYRLLIAADGPHSTVARLLGWPALRTVNTRQYTVRLLRPCAATDVWLSERYPGGYAWLFPKGGFANLGAGMDPACDADMKTALDLLHGKLVREGRAGREIISRTGGAIPVGGLREGLAAGNVVFVGDAAGLTHPISGAGIAAAVASGERAGEAAHALLAVGDGTALEEYEEDIRDQFGHTLERALERRRQLEDACRGRAAGSDAVQRRGWIAFEEYFQEPLCA